MKKRLISAILALFVLASLTTFALAGDAPTPIVSDNRDANSYLRWAKPVTSYLYESPDGGLTRVEYLPSEKEYQNVDGVWQTVTVSEARLLVETYSGELEITSSRSIPLELPIWGGFFAGETYNFVIVGQENTEESDSKEVIRVVKYSKDWKRLGSAGLFGANTTVPFDAGSLRCDEYGGTLYIRTCHEMYTTPDGLNHQANVTMAVEEETMKVTDSYTIVMNSSVGYVSHSFNQFVLIDSEARIVTVDHGDAHPRSLTLMVYDTPAGNGKFSGSVSGADVVTFPGAAGANTTGASVGGLAETTNGYAVAYSYDGAGNSDDTRNRSVYLGFVGKSGLSAGTVLVSEPGVHTPVLAPTGLDGGWILWQPVDESGYDTDTVSFARYSADGTVGQTRTMEAALSDCAPIRYQGKTVWYVTDGSTLRFFALDDNGSLTTREFLGFSDVHQGDYFYEAVKWAKANKVTEGDGSPTTFNPDGTCTRAQVLTFLWRAVRGSNVSYVNQAFPDVAESDYFYYPINWAKIEDIVTAPLGQNIYPDAPCPRSEIVLYLWRAAGSPAPTTANPFIDVNSSDEYYSAVLWAYEAGITKGDGALDTFNPTGTCTRAQVVTFLMRYVEQLNK